MTCRHDDTSLSDPLPFKGNELRKYLGIPNTRKGREIRKGRIPKGVIVCDRNNR